MATTDLLSPRARRLLQLLTPEPVALDSATPEGAAALQELVRYGLATGGLYGLCLTREGIRVGERYELRN